jgi:hypothetical protein
MNRLAVWTVASVIAAAVAVFDLVSAWAIHMNVVIFVLSLSLFGVAVLLFVALLITGVGERRRILAGAVTPLEVVGRGASRVRTNALAAIALSILLFANCSGSVTSGPPTNAGAMDDVAGFLKGSAEVFLPAVLLIVLAAALATAAQVFANRDQWRSARKSAQWAIWASVAIAIVAVGTVPLGFIFLVSQCFFGTSPGACAAGAGSFTNVFMVGTFALLLPYIQVIVRALRTAPSPGADEVR